MMFVSCVSATDIRNQSSDILLHSQNRPTGDMDKTLKYDNPNSRRKFDKSNKYTKELGELITQATNGIYQ